MTTRFERPRAAPPRPTLFNPAENHESSTSRRRGERYAAPAESVPGQKVPHLNVITNFSKPNPVISTNSHEYRHQREHSLQERRRKQRMNGGSRGRIETLKTEDPVSALSPSDRELVIGMSVPGPPSGSPKPAAGVALTVKRSPRAKRSPRPERPPRAKRSLRAKRSPRPEIIVTPAGTSPPRTLLAPAKVRATSSIYSRFPNGVIRSSDLPPMPLDGRCSFATTIESSSRCTSWASDFSEDDTLKHSRPESRESQRKIWDRKSIDSIATKHRSRGWWNQILSPFLERPDLSNALAVDQVSPVWTTSDADEGKWNSSKVSDEKEVQHDGIWADLEGHSIVPVMQKFFTEPGDPTFNGYPGVHHGETVATPELIETRGPKRSPVAISYLGDRSPEIENIKGMGLAAEYFEAYWHDQYSPTAYFKCENHLCSYGRGIWNGNADTARAAAAERDLLVNGRGRGEGEANEPSQSRDVAFADAEGDGDGTKLSEQPTATKLRTRPTSVATTIEEDNPAPSNKSKGGRNSQQPKDLRVRPLPGLPADASPASPPALTPSMKTDFAERRALQLQPAPPPGLPEEPAPRYPPVDNARGFPPAMPKHTPPPAFSPPVAHGGEPPAGASGSTGVASTMHVAQMDRVVTSERRFDAGGGGHAAHEINDSHPIAAFPPPPKAETTKETTDSQVEPKDKKAKKGLFRSVFGTRKARTKKQKKQRRLFCCIFFGLLLMVVLIVVLVVELTLPRSDMAVQTSWLNISNYPPVPTGIATIIRPSVASQNGCIKPQTMWSCALPKEQQASIQPNPADQPNFRVEIRFQNGTNLTSNSTFTKRSNVLYGMSFVELFRAKVLGKRDSFTSALFSPNPAPPGAEDQAFLGKTTDNNSVPYAGEATPFFISFLDADRLGGSRRLIKRQTTGGGNSTNSTDPFPNLANDIPPPSTNPDGTAASANLYPFPTAQPLMLYNRGQSSEHYGFYTYFDRSIFLKSASVQNISLVGEVPDDENGGATESEASLRCTWAQTRFLVQIWTNTKGNAVLLSANKSDTAQPTATTGGASAQSTQSSVSASSSSANDFTVPGSFPYPVSITMDRHGGDINSKSVYCYGVDDRERIVASEKQFQMENRAIGGKLVNPALGLFTQINVTLAEGGPGGIDGGSGGCSCTWRNFQENT